MKEQSTIKIDFWDFVNLLHDKKLILEDKLSSQLHEIRINKSSGQKTGERMIDGELRNCIYSEITPRIPECIDESMDILDNFQLLFEVVS